MLGPPHASFIYVRCEIATRDPLSLPPRLRGLALVVLQQTAQPLPTPHRCLSISCSFPLQRKQNQILFALVVALLVIQLDNATPIILNREKSVTFGTLGTLALWLFMKPSPEMGELCFSVASMRSQELGSWRSHNGCSIRWPAAVCAWRRCPRSAAVRCWI